MGGLMSATTDLFAKVLTSLETIPAALAGLKGSVDQLIADVAELRDARRADSDAEKVRWERRMLLFREITAWLDKVLDRLGSACRSKMGAAILGVLVISLAANLWGMDVATILSMRPFNLLLGTTTESTTTTHEGGADDDGDAR